MNFNNLGHICTRIAFYIFCILTFGVLYLAKATIEIAIVDALEYMECKKEYDKHGTRK